MFSTIFLKLKGLWATFIDFLEYTDYSNYASHGVRVMYPNKDLQKKMTNLFKKTKVNVFVYESKFLNAFTYPGVVKMFSPLMSRLQYILTKIPVIGNYFSSFFGIFFLLEANQRLNKSTLDKKQRRINRNSKLIIDPTTKKAELSIDEATVYVSSSLIDSFTEDEIIAVLLHEVGHNTMIQQGILQDILYSVRGSALITLLFQLVKYYMNIEKTNPLSPMLTWTIGTIVMWFIIEFSLLYVNRRHEVLADEFAIKMGYGEALYSGQLKFRKFGLFDIFGEKFKKIKDSNMLDKLLNVWSTIWHWISIPFQKLWLEAHPDTFTRSKMIKEKTEKFNKEIKNKLDRSSAIYGDNWYDKMMDPDVKQIKENLDIIINNVKLLNS